VNTDNQIKLAKLRHSIRLEVNVVQYSDVGRRVCAKEILAASALQLAQLHHQLRLTTFNDDFILQFLDLRSGGVRQQ